MRRALIFLIGIATTLALASCTTAQVHWYLNEATPEQRTAVDHALREQAAEAQRRAASPSLHPFLTCVRRHESDRGPYPHTNGYQAQNPRSSASGAYQFINGTWQTMSARAGYPGYSRAMHAPVHVQDAVALYTYRTQGASPWAGSGCR